MLSKLEYDAMSHINMVNLKRKIFHIFLCNIGMENGFRFNYKGVLNMVTVQIRLLTRTLMVQI